MEVVLIHFNQLFPPQHLRAKLNSPVLMVEDWATLNRYQFHKHRIGLLLASYRAYAEELKVRGHNVVHIPVTQKPILEIELDRLVRRTNAERLVTFEPANRSDAQRLVSICGKLNLELQQMRSPMFLVSKHEFSDYLSHAGKPWMRTFYEQMRTKKKILMTESGEPIGGQWSFDHQNRKKLPRDWSIPPRSELAPTVLLEEALRDTDNLFASNPGSTQNFWLPVTRLQWLGWYKQFLDEYFDVFGQYQDAMTTKSDFVFHSVISPAMNLGILTPSEIIQKAIRAWKERDLPLNSLEGFVRQVLGWREFVHGIDHHFGQDQSEKNFFGHQRGLTQAWYDGNTGLLPVDATIKKIARTGYAHHIERLMILSNVMLLSEVHPQSAYSWFMEMFVDSDEWVMGPNVFGMGLFSDGGIFATKPYICASNYIRKMSDFPGGEWTTVLDGLYWRFINNNQSYFRKNARLGFMVSLLHKMPEIKKEKLFNAADIFIERNTRPKPKGKVRSLGKQTIAWEQLVQ